ncbi:hypothetical protein NQ318_020274 [Aromia moschata]|uniref:Uncharacterized protein n=1 Tax=Aromia moschata TaxID=1265417 RepID=A0AAV8ZA63_9CUCU|nr:hypothetical protein NQ318_020274 [Aromia moschata]
MSSQSTLTVKLLGSDETLIAECNGFTVRLLQEVLQLGRGRFCNTPSKRSHFYRRINMKLGNALYMKLFTELYLVDNVKTIPVI